MEISSLSGCVFSTFTLTGVFVVSSSIFIGGTFTGSPVPNLILKICLYFLINFLNLCIPVSDNTLPAASLTLFANYLSMSSYRSLPK